MSIFDRLERDFGRVLGMTPTPDAQDEMFVSPDLGNPDQHFDVPGPIEFGLSPEDRHAATMAKIELESQRRAANKRDADADLAKLGVEFMEVGR